MDYLRFFLVGLQCTFQLSFLAHPQKGWLERILFPFYSAGIVFVYPERFNLAHPEEEDNQPGLILPGPVGDVADANPVPPVVWGTLPIYANYVR